jgi:glycosyltransferase involved in cell wall biosynthesis
MKVLMASGGASNYDGAYVQRLSMIQEGLKRSGVDTSILHTGDYFFTTPYLIRILNTPFYFKLTRGYDVIHAAGTTAAICMGLMKTFHNYKVVFDVHGNGIEEARLLRKSALDIKGNYVLFQSMILLPIGTNIADYFVTASDTLKQVYVNKGFDEQRIEVIRNGVDTQLFRPAESPVENETFTVTYAGSFLKWQGIENLVDAAKLLRDENLKFKMIGFKSKDLGLKQEIKRISKNKVELIDAVPRRTLVHHLNESDVLIIPRYCPPNEKSWDRLRNTFGWLPTKFSEYIATGRPVIVTMLDETSDLVEKYDCGFVCDPTPEAIAKTILEAKETSFQTLQKKGMNSRRLAEVEFDVSVIGRRYHRFLTRILEK